MDFKSFLAYAEGIGLEKLESALEAMVRVQLLTTPNASDADVAIAIDGHLKHEARGKIGFAVDFIWPFIKGHIDTAILAAIATVKGE